MIKKIIGIVLIVGGVFFIGLSLYIKEQVEQGKMQVADAQHKVNTSGQLFSLNPYTKEVGQGITSSAQNKIDEANRTIAQYAQYSTWFMNGGIALVVIGIGVLFIPTKKRKW